MMEAAGVEPGQVIENTQVVDSKSGQNGKKGQKGKSTVQMLYIMPCYDRPPHTWHHPSILPRMVQPQADF
jgi:hypothetical protein